MCVWQGYGELSLHECKGETMIKVTYMKAQFLVFTFLVLCSCSSLLACFLRDFHSNQL